MDYQEIAIKEDEEEININFVCPFCKKEVQENDQVIFDPNKQEFWHEKCYQREYYSLEEPEDADNSEYAED